MGFFDFFKREDRATAASAENDVIAALLNPDTVTKDMALEIPEIAGTIDLIAGIVAGTPIKLYKETKGKIEEVKIDNRLALLNEDTGDTLTSNEFWRAVTRDYFLGKGGYAYINKNRNKIVSLHYVNEENIAITQSLDPIFKDFDIYVAGEKYYPWDFIRILRNTKDGAKGTPITAENSRLISVAYASLKYELNAAKRGGNKKGFLKSEKKLDEASLNALKSAFSRLYSNDTESSEPFIVLNGGIDFKESSNTLVEMQLNENKLTNAKEFAKLFHVSPEAVSGGQAATSTIAKLAAIPLMKVIESALNRDLLLEREKSTMYFAFDTKELLKGEIEERYRAYKTALDANFMQIDEVRYLEDMEPLGLNFIKLGLQDVLYNPETKEVFTPNTGITQNLDSGALLSKGEDGIIESRANPNHDPKDERFATEASSQGANEFKVKGFRNNQHLNNHWEKHQNEYISEGVKTKEDYLQKALALIQSPCDNGIEGYKNKLNQICRYDVKTNDFVKGSIDKGIFTMFKPEDGKKYFDDLKKIEGVEDLDE